MSEPKPQESGGLQKLLNFIDNQIGVILKTIQSFQQSLGVVVPE
jgi:hypothetical protein